MCEFCNTKFYVQVERYSKPILAPLTEVEELECELINKTGFQYMQIQNNYCPLCRKEAGRVIKEFCDICKVEIDNQNVLAIVSTPVKTYKVCKECLDDLIQHIQNKENNFKLESKRYERDYNKKWNEIC